MAVVLPVDIPTDLDNQTNYGVVLPITIPVNLSGNSIRSITLPITLPINFTSSNINYGEVKLKVFEKINLDEKIGKVGFVLKETPVGKTTKLKIRETAWKFDGLILSENIIAEMSQQLSIVENVQALILVDFELISSTKIKIKWYGSSVPSLRIMKKSVADEDYTNSEIYNWGTSEAVIDIASEDYNIYLKGEANSGSSQIYTIAGVNDVLVIPDVEVILNDKLYVLDINYISKYDITVNY